MKKTSLPAKLYRVFISLGLTSLCFAIWTDPTNTLIQIGATATTLGLLGAYAKDWLGE